jgi:hypothetical protein
MLRKSATLQFRFKNTFILSQRILDRLSPLARMIFLSKQGGSRFKFSVSSQSRYLRKGTRVPVKALFENLEDGVGFGDFPRRFSG